MNISNDIAKNHKKRGRKPKGGKILLVNQIPEHTPDQIINTILHLKCGLHDLKNSFSSKITHDMVESYQFLNKDIGFNLVNKSECNEAFHTDKATEEESSVNQKLITLAHDLHNNTNSDKRAACFGVRAVSIIILLIFLNIQSRDITMCMDVFVVQNVLRVTYLNNQILILHVNLKDIRY